MSDRTFNIGGRIYSVIDSEYSGIKDLFDKYDQWLDSQGAISSSDYIRQQIKKIST